MRQLLEWEQEGKSRILGENMNQWLLVRHKSHKAWNRTWAAAIAPNHMSSDVVLSLFNLTHRNNEIRSKCQRKCLPVIPYVLFTKTYKDTC